MATAFAFANAVAWALLFPQLPDQQAPRPSRSADEAPAKFSPCFFVAPYSLLGKAVSEPGIYLALSSWADWGGGKLLAFFYSVFLGINYPAILAAREPESGPCGVSALNPAVLIGVSTVQWALIGGLSSQLMSVRKRVTSQR